MSWLARAIDAGHEYRKPLAEIEDDLFLDIGAQRAKKTKFWVQLVLASVIAAGGVIGNSTPAVIGAMIIAPLGTPIYGLALAAVAGERRELRRSLALLVSGIVVNILIGVVIGLVTVNRMPIDVNPQIVGRTAPTLLDLVRRRRGRRRRVVRAHAQGRRRHPRRRGHRHLAGPGARRGRHHPRRLARLTSRSAPSSSSSPTPQRSSSPARSCSPPPATSAKPSIATRAPDAAPPSPSSSSSSSFWSRSAAASMRTLLYEKWTRDVQTDTEQWLQGTEWHLDTVTVSNDEIVVTVIGPGDPPSRDQLKKAIREDVPDSVPVKVMEEAGRTTTL